MMDLSGVGTLALLSALAGGIHVIAPDHWVPTSVLAWRRRWGTFVMVGFAILVYSAHVLAGVVVYLGFQSAFEHLPWNASSRTPFLLTLAMVGLIGLLRIARFYRVQSILYSAPDSRIWGFLSVLSVIGPAEALLPVLIKSNGLGAGLLMPVLSFWLGTLAVGLPMVLGGQWFWNQPLLLPRGLAWAGRRRAAIPIVTGIAIGLAWVLRT